MDSTEITVIKSIMDFTVIAVINAIMNSTDITTFKVSLNVAVMHKGTKENLEYLAVINDIV
jgi:hypothetical protein